MHQRQRAHVEPAPILSLSTATEQASYELTDGVGLHVRFECQVGVLKVVEGGDRGPQRSPGPLFKSCDIDGHSAGDRPQVAPRLPPSGLAGRHERVARSRPLRLCQVDRRGDSGAGEEQRLAQRLSILAARRGQGLSPLSLQGEHSGGATSRRHQHSPPDGVPTHAPSEEPARRPCAEPDGPAGYLSHLGGGSPRSNGLTASTIRSSLPVTRSHSKSVRSPCIVNRATSTTTGGSPLLGERPPSM